MGSYLGCRCTKGSVPSTNGSASASALPMAMRRWGECIGSRIQSLGCRVLGSNPVYVDMFVGLGLRVVGFGSRGAGRWRKRRACACGTSTLRWTDAKGCFGGN